MINKSFTSGEKFMTITISQNQEKSIVDKSVGDTKLRIGQRVKFHGAYSCEAKIVKMTDKNGVVSGFKRLTLETVSGDRFETDEWNVTVR